MISVNDVSLAFGKRVLFESVNLKFTNGNCYGVIGANGSGKTTFLKLLKGEIDTTKGTITIDKNDRLSYLEQDHYKYDNEKVLDVVIRGNERLYEIMKLKEELYNKPDFTDADGITLGNLEAEFSEMNGWAAESDAGELLSNLGVDIMYHDMLMKELQDNLKVKVLLAKALFGDPDILLLDEPTNNLDDEAINWLEEYLINFNNTIIVVSHDRYFLNKVCTHIIDIDYSKITLFVGNYDFWYSSSELIKKQMKESNAKKEDKIKELKDFIARFSANASKSRQATSRKKILEKIELDEIIPSSRKYPFIDFKIENMHGKDILSIKDLIIEIDGKRILDKVSFTVMKDDKIAFVGTNNLAKTTLFNVIMKEIPYHKGEVLMGKTIKPSYFPIDNTNYFENDLDIMGFLSQYGYSNDPQALRGFLGRMLFTEDEVFKKVKVLSGGEKARIMLSKMMLENPNFLIFDEVTNHLDMETITAVNKAMQNFKGEILFASRDHELVSTVANRIIEIDDFGKIKDYRMSYDEYLEKKFTK